MAGRSARTDNRPLGRTYVSALLIASRSANDGGTFRLKILPLPVVLVLAVFIVSCGRGEAVPSATPFVPSLTPAPTQPATLTPVSLSPTPSGTPTEITTPTATGTVGPTFTPTTPPEARLTSQCLDVLPALPSGSASSGVVVLQNRVSIGGRLNGETYLLDLAAGTTITVEHGGFGSPVSPDRTLMAYNSTILDAQDRITANNLIIANASGKQLKAIPWETDWAGILGWTDDRRLVLYRSKPGVTFLKYDTYLVLDPFTGQRQVLGRDFPKFTNQPYQRTLGWEGWYGVLYDPTLTRVVYPQLVGKNDQQLTYALWDVSRQRLVASLENSFELPARFNDIYPMPHWSPDGSKFVFRGLVDVSPNLALFELYSVSRDGQVEQLTHLTSVALVQDSNLSWSPDGRYIAMFLNHWRVDISQEPARAAVLDTTNLEITDYCVPISSGEGLGLPRPIWSPNGKQFLVSEQGVSHPRVILVDVTRGFAAQISQDTEATGWMVPSQ